MVIALYKYWGVAGIDAKTFSIVFLKSLAPVIVTLAAGYSASNICKFFFGIGTVIGGALDTIIASAGTIIIGSAVTLYLSQYVYDSRQLTNKAALEENVQSFMKTSGFKQMVDDLKQLAKNPKKITNQAVVEIIQKNTKNGKNQN
jgi:uncharacterized protein (DUF697 family)